MVRHHHRHRPGFGPHDVRRGETGEAFRLAVSEFLRVPLLVITALLALGLLAYAADRAETFAGLRDALDDRVFRTPEKTGDLLQTIAQTVITVTSITFSLLLIALQQTASSLSNSVVDQYLRRTTNQVNFAFFVGVGLTSVLLVVTVSEEFNPVLAATLVLAETVVAVFLLLVLLYTTVNQMRPAVVIEAIHDATVEARARQLRHIVLRTRRRPVRDELVPVPIRSERTGFILQIDLPRLQHGIDAAGGGEIVLGHAIGDYVAYQDVLAEVRAADEERAREIGRVLERSVRRERQRNIDHFDANYGLEQLADIGWGAVSSARHAPLSARLVIANLRDVLVRTTAEQREAPDEPDYDVVYADDFEDKLMSTFESLAVAAGESRQHQSYAETLGAFAAVLDRLPDGHGERARDVILRTLPQVSEHAPTRALQRAFQEVGDALERHGDDEAADQVRRHGVEEVAVTDADPRRGERATTDQTP